MQAEKIRALEEQKLREQEERERQDGRQLNIGKSLSTESPKQKQQEGSFQADFEVNDADDYLKPYLDPLLSNIGSARVNFSENAPVNSLGDQTFQICGNKLWNCLHNDGWRNREAAGKAFLDYLNQDSLEKHMESTGTKLNLFQASMVIARVCCLDKLLAVYFVGLKLLHAAMNPPVCDE